MKKLVPISTIVLAVLLTGCSHNPSVLTVGKKLHIGTTEYGEITYLNGFAIVDCSRENSEWQIDINDSDGLSYNPATQTLKGVRSIRRRIGKQVTGYLKDISEQSPEAVTEYLKGDIMFIALPANKAEIKEDGSLVKTAYNAYRSIVEKKASSIGTIKNATSVDAVVALEPSEECGAECIIWKCEQELSKSGLSSGDRKLLEDKIKEMNDYIKKLVEEM